ncbi:hypothetical protein [Rhodanobacter hydrolyticus]|uniref:Uncharacterized protein n=1 Tax=Rhodanobacter hydrolyticus TaxID=2250595 RepID=A0ABW8J5A8_9GAMM
MSARHWMIGCLIGLAGMGSAMASDLGARDITATSRPAADSNAHDAGGNGGADALGLNRDCPASHRGSDADNGDADARGNGTAGGSEHGGRISAPTTAKPATLGWQSLLPGSIQ